MPRPPVPPAKYLLVEGKDDQHVVRHLCGLHRLPQSFDVEVPEGDGGITELLEGLTTRIRTPNWPVVSFSTESSLTRSQLGSGGGSGPASDVHGGMWAEILSQGATTAAARPYPPPMEAAVSPVAHTAPDASLFRHVCATPSPPFPHLADTCMPYHRDRHNGG